MESYTITFQIKYVLSDEYRTQQFEETGKRPGKRQALEVESTELPAAVRKKLLDLPGGWSPGKSVTKTRSLTLPEFKVKTRKRVAKDPDTFSGGFIRLDDYPTYKTPSATRASPPVVAMDEPLTPETVGAALEKRDQRTKEIRAEYEQALDDAASRLIELLRENIDRDWANLPPSMPVLKPRVLSDFEDTPHYEDLEALKEEAEALNERREEIKARRKEQREEERRKKRERRTAERKKWIDEHGSDVLQMAIEEGYDCQRRYAVERTQKEHHEDFYLDFDDTSECKERSCPSEEALRFAQEAGGEVVWLTQPGTEAEDEDAPRHFEPREAVQKSIRLGEHGQRYTLIREF